MSVESGSDTLEHQERIENWNAVGHVVDPEQRSRDWIEQELVPLAEYYKQQVDAYDYESTQIFKGMPAIINFQEPSTRTFISSLMAASRLGFNLLPMVGKEFSSQAKGESLTDMMEMFEGNKPALSVIRFSDTGAAAQAADILKTPLVNAGDGKGHHPTQGYLDIFTLNQLLGGEIRGGRFVLGGDIKRGRTLRSLATLLSTYDDVELSFISRPDFTMDDDLRAKLQHKNVRFDEIVIEEKGDFIIPSRYLEGASAAYWSRTQLERAEQTEHTSFEEELASAAESEDDASGVIFAAMEIVMREAKRMIATKPNPWKQPELIIGEETMKWLKSNTWIMHPLPRIREVSRGVDSDPRAAYFEQAANGLPVRMALMHLAMYQRFPDKTPNPKDYTLAT